MELSLWSWSVSLRRSPLCLRMEAPAFIRIPKKFLEYVERKVMRKGCGQLWVHPCHLVEFSIRRHFRAPYNGNIITSTCQRRNQGTKVFRRWEKGLVSQDFSVLSTTFSVDFKLCLAVISSFFIHSMEVQGIRQWCHTIFVSIIKHILIEQYL